MRLQHVFHLVIAFIALSALPASTSAQITLDGSLGPKGSLIGPNYTISSSFGQTRGGNLFHSFGLFNVFSGERATFTGPSSISNIIGRVTGGQTSVIDGLIRSNISGANLFLINPAGMVFGPNARLNVSGSFHASTADYLKFAEGAKFHADLTRESVLTSAAVSAFGFLSQNPAGISIQKNLLQIPAGKTLSMVGGEIEILGNPFFTDNGFPTLSSYGGKLQLASVASPGEVPHTVEDLNPSLFERMGNISLSNAAYLDVSNYLGGAPGSVIIRGGRLMVDNSLILANNEGVVSANGAAIDARLSGAATIKRGSLIAADTFGLGQSGNIFVEAENATLSDGSVISNSTFGAGNGGSLQIRTAGTLTLLNQGLIIASPQSGSTGNAGDITIDAKDVVATSGGRIFNGTAGSRNGGTLTIHASETVTVAGTNSNGFNSRISASALSNSTGQAGNIIVEAKNVMVSGGAEISSGTFGLGSAGSVRVTADDTVTLSGIGGFTKEGFVIASTITASNQPGSAGNAGGVTVQAKNITATGGAQISSATSGPGHGGDVAVTASGNLSLDGVITAPRGPFPTGVFASNQPGSTGEAGDVAVTAKNVTLTGGAQIASTTYGPKDAGSVRVTAAESINLSTGATIGSITFAGGNGGTVQVTAGDTIRIEGTRNGSPAGIFATADRGSTGNAGNIVVEAKNISAAGAGQIAAATFGPGNAGAVRVTATGTITLDGSDGFAVNGLPLASGIYVSNQPGSRGDAGDLTVAASNLNISNGAGIFSDTFGPGTGGKVAVTVGDRLGLTGSTPDGSGSAISSSSFGGGPGGNVEVQARQISLNDGATLTATSSGTGVAGDISVRADELRMVNSSVTTQADFADGGNIHLTVAKMVDMLNSQITATVKSGSGSGGNITIDPQFVILNHSQIIANAFEGPGGHMRMVADIFLASPDSVVSASSASGPQGVVEIQAPITDLTGTLAPLPENVVQATSLLQQSCATRFNERKLSSLVVASRDTLPLEPGGFMPSPLFSTRDQRSEVRDQENQTTIGGQSSVVPSTELGQAPLRGRKSVRQIRLRQ